MNIDKENQLKDIQKVFELEEYIKQNTEGSDIEWIHRFLPGLYCREMYVPQGNLMTGMVHKEEHISIFLEGILLVPDADEEAINGSKIIEAPMIEITPPGMKRVGVALTDVRWITVHASEAKTKEEAEEQIFTNDPQEVYDLLMVDSLARVEYQKDKGFGQRKLIEEQ